MAEQHIKAASTNLRRAATDLKNEEQQIRADAENQKRELEKRQVDIRTEQQRLRSHASDSSNKTIQADMTLLVAKLEEEYNQINKTLSEIGSTINKEVQNIEEQAREFGGLADRLESAS